MWLILMKKINHLAALLTTYSSCHFNRNLSPIHTSEEKWLLVCQAGWWICLFSPRHCVHDSRFGVSGGRVVHYPGAWPTLDCGGLRLEHALKPATVICMHGASARRRRCRRPIMSSNFLPREEMWFVAGCGGGDGHYRITLEHLTLSPEELTKTKVHPPVMIRPWLAKAGPSGEAEWRMSGIRRVCLCLSAATQVGVSPA